MIGVDEFIVNKSHQVRLEDAEQAALKAGKKTVAKLEQRCREIEGGASSLIFA